MDARPEHVTPAGRPVNVGHSHEASTWETLQSDCLKCTDEDLNKVYMN